MKDAIAVFHQAELAIDDYEKKIRHVIFLISDHLDNGTPISNELRDLLMDKTQASHLQRCAFILNDIVLIIQKRKQRMQQMLGNSDGSEAAYLARSLTSAFFRSIETITGEGPYESDLLPPDYIYFKKIEQQIDNIFPRTVDSPLETKEERQFSNYLRTVENPWAKYVND